MNSPVDQMRESLLMLAENLEPVREFLVGYKTKLESSGFHSVSADRMCEQVHAELVRVMFHGLGGAA